MRFRNVLFITLAASTPALHLVAQSICTTNASQKPLICEVPVAVGNVPSGGSTASSAATQTTVAINSSIAAQLTQLPVPSGTVGTVLLKGGEAGVIYNNLGPILTDRPDTVGRRRLYAGFSYQHFNFNSIDGINLSSLPFAYQFNPSNSSTQVSFGSQTSNIAFTLDQYVALVTFGASRTTDISAIVPVNSVHLNSTTTATTFTCSSVVAGTSCGYNPLGPISATIAGSASGIGDLQFTVKQLIHGQDRSRTAVAIGGTLRLPTGDQNNYLGSGAYGFNAFALFSYRARFSPHLKLANQWNGPSPLVNPNGDANGSKNLPGGVQFDAGADVSVVKRVTAAVDILGNQFTNTTSLQSSVLTLSPTPTGSTPSAIPNTTSFNNTYTTLNVSAGLKYKPVKDLLLYGNVLIQLNNVGLRSSPVPLAGISYNFNLHK